MCLQQKQTPIEYLGRNQKDIDQMESRKGIKKLSDWLKWKGCRNKACNSIVSA